MGLEAVYAYIRTAAVMYLLNAGTTGLTVKPLYALHSVEGGEQAIAMLDGKWGA